METVFMKAWEHLPHFGGKKKERNFRAWLFRIAHNSLIDHFRTKKVNISLESVSQNRSADAEPERVVVQNEEVKRIHKAITRLDDVSRQVIISRFFGGLSHKETAQSVGVNENNVRIIQYRALRKLNDLLSEKMNEKRKARIIIECLDEVQSGRMSREECKQKYPGLAEELQSIFSSSETLSSMQFPEIDNDIDDDSGNDEIDNGSDDDLDTDTDEDSDDDSDNGSDSDSDDSDNDSDSDSNDSDNDIDSDNDDSDDDSDNDSDSGSDDDNGDDD